MLATSNKRFVRNSNFNYFKFLFGELAIWNKPHSRGAVWRNTDFLIQGHWYNNHCLPHDKESVYDQLTVGSILLACSPND